MSEIVFDSSVDSDILKNQQPKINYKKLLIHLKLKFDAFLFIKFFYKSINLTLYFLYYIIFSIPFV